MGLFQKQEGYLGIDIGAQGMKLVELRKTKSRPQLWTYALLHHPIDIHELAPAGASMVPPADGAFMSEGQKQPVSPITADDPRIDEYAQLLKELVKKSQATSRRATASLPVSQVFHAVITLPTVDLKELDHHVRAKVKKMLPQSIDDMQVVHQLIPNKEEDKKPKFMRVLVTAAPKPLVSFYSAIFQKAGLQLEELETEAFALERSLVGHDQSTIMLVDIGAERTNFFVVDQGLPITHRSIALGGDAIDKELSARLGIDIALVNQMKIDLSRSPKTGNSAAVFTNLFDPIVKEIEYSVDLFIHQTGNEGKRLEKIILTGGAALFPPIIDVIRQSFSVNVFIGDPWARVVYQPGLRQVLDDIGARMAVSIGLAMRNIV